MKRALRLVALSPAIAVMAFATHAPSPSPMSRSDFRADMRKLWEDHITWTRIFLITAIDGLPSKDATTQRLLQNQADIGNAIKPFYGDDAGAQLAGLLKGHILLAAEVVGAAKAGDETKKNDAAKRWTNNADSIAAFLAKANPKNWTESDLKSMLHDHLAMTTDEATAHLKKDWTADIAAYDKVHEQILKMSDALSSGVIKQFPDKFSKQMAER